MTDIKRFSLMKPTAQTRFHIDFDWWAQTDSDWRVYLHSLLCNEHQLAFSDLSASDSVDWIDPETAEIQCVDGLHHTLMSHCAKDPSFIGEHTALVDAVFRVFITNGNTPLSIGELAERLKRPADTLLKTIAHGRVFRGLRPITEPERERSPKKLPAG